MKTGFFPGFAQKPGFGPKNRVLTEPGKNRVLPQNPVFGPKNRVLTEPGKNRVLSQNPVLGPKNRVLTEPLKKPGWPQNRVFGPKNRVWGQTRAPSPACCGTLGGIRQLPAAWGAFYVLALITDNGPSETRVVRRSQARGRMASQPHTNHHARAKADRQTDRTGSNPHTDQTPQRESPPPKDTPWCVGRYAAPPYGT